MKKIIFSMAVLVMGLAFTACSSDDDNNSDNKLAEKEQAMQAITDQYVNNVIFPIYQSLATQTSTLFDQLVEAKSKFRAGTLAQSDIVILTLPLNDSTYHLFNSDRMSKMKDGSVLVNMSRGKIIDEQALPPALQNRKPAFAVLDVFEQEPLEPSNPLWKVKNLIITPHNSFVSEKNFERLFQVIFKNLQILSK